MTKEAAASWPANNPVQMAIDELVPYARNSRAHSDQQVDQIAASIREWGFTNPVLIDPDGNIIAGHGRVIAAKKIGIESVPCVVADGWTEAQRRAYVIADNKLALNGEWDDAVLRDEVLELQEVDFNLDLLGFAAPEISPLLFEADSAASFLNDMTASPNDGEVGDVGEGYEDKGDAQDRPKSGVNLTFIMPAEDRDVVVRWLVAFRDKHGLDTQAQALAEMAKKEFSL